MTTRMEDRKILKRPMKKEKKEKMPSTKELAGENMICAIGRHINEDDFEVHHPHGGPSDMSTRGEEGGDYAGSTGLIRGNDEVPVGCTWGGTQNDDDECVVEGAVVENYNVDATGEEDVDGETEGMPVEDEGETSKLGKKSNTRKAGGQVTALRKSTRKRAALKMY